MRQSMGKLETKEFYTIKTASYMKYIGNQVMVSFPNMRICQRPALMIESPGRSYYALWVLACHYLPVRSMQHICRYGAKKLPVGVNKLDTLFIHAAVGSPTEPFAQNCIQQGDSAYVLNHANNQNFMVLRSAAKMSQQYLRCY